MPPCAAGCSRCARRPWKRSTPALPRSTKRSAKPYSKCTNQEEQRCQGSTRLRLVQAGRLATQAETRRSFGRCRGLVDTRESEPCRPINSRRWTPPARRSRTSSTRRARRKRRRRSGRWDTSSRRSPSRKAGKPQPRRRRPGRSKTFALGGVGSKQLTTFTRQLSILQDAGLPILRSLKILENQAKPGALKNCLMDVCDEIEGGATLSEAMAKSPKAFDRLYVNMIKAGEAGGALEVILQRLAEFQERSQSLEAQSQGRLGLPGRRRRSSPWASCPSS